MTTRNILGGDPPGKLVIPLHVQGAEGAELLDHVEAYARRFLILPSADAYVAFVLWAAHAHAVDCFEATPRMLFSSPEPGSGKTRALEILEVLCPRPVNAVNVTPSYLFRKVEDEAGRPTILFDEVDTVFGPKAKDNEEIRGFLNAGHRRGAMAGRCVMKGRAIEVEEIEAYCPVAMAGLGYVPDTVSSRSVIVRMRRRSGSESVEPYRRRLHDREGHSLRDDLAAWTEVIGGQLSSSWPDMPPEVTDRDADVWEPLIAIADLAGGDWPMRARVAAVALVADAKRKPPSLGVRLLADLRTVFGDQDQLASETVLEGLRGMDEAPWADLKGKPLDARGLARMLGDYEIKSTTVRIGHSTPKGYRRVDLHDAWARYLPPLPMESATSATAATPIDPDDDPFGDPL